MTKKERKQLFKERMEEGYQNFQDGLLTHSEWNYWSWHCYKFQDEEITYEQLMEKLKND